MQPLVDMSGCNDAFNSSIVSLTVKARYKNICGSNFAAAQFRIFFVSANLAETNCLKFMNSRFPLSLIK